MNTAIVMARADVAREEAERNCCAAADWTAIEDRASASRMDKFVIEGGTPLDGEICISGAKNSALPALAACLLTDEPVVLHRIPRVRDIRTMERLLGYIGATVEEDGGASLRRPRQDDPAPEAPYELVKTMRASSLVLGPLVGARRAARASPCPAAAPSARVPSTCTSAGLEQLGATHHARSTATSKPTRPNGLQRRHGLLRPHHRHRHRRHADGRRPRRRRDHHRKRRPRARSRRTWPPC